jgi:hypothetical protein
MLLASANASHPCSMKMCSSISPVEHSMCLQWCCRAWHSVENHWWRTDRTPLESWVYHKGCRWLHLKQRCNLFLTYSLRIPAGLPFIAFCARLCSWSFRNGALKRWRARRSSNCALHLLLHCRWWHQQRSFLGLDLLLVYLQEDN